MSEFQELFRVLWVLSYGTLVLSIMFSGIILMWPGKSGGPGGVKRFWIWKFRIMWNIISRIVIFGLNFIANIFGAETKKKPKKKGKKRKK